MEKVIFITGGSGKIGSSFIADAIAKDYFLVTTTRNIESYKVKHPQLFELDNFLAIEVNLAKQDAVETIVNKLSEKKVKVNTIIHNARDLTALKIEDDRTVSTDNFNRELYLAIVLPYVLNNALIDSDHPLENIIFISSIYGIVAPTPSLYDDFTASSPINYGVAKSGQIHLTKELAVRLADKNIRVNCISFGGIEGRVTEEFLQRYKKLCPQAGMLKEADVLGPLHFLVSDASKNMTGHNLVVDGGWTIW